MNKLLRFKLLLGFFLLLGILSAKAVNSADGTYHAKKTNQSSKRGSTITAKTTGPWTDPRTWIGDVVPTTGDIAIIPAGITVTYSIGHSLSIANPEIRVYGAMQFYGSYLTSTEVTFTNDVPITIYKGGAWLDNLNGSGYFFPGNNRVAMSFEAGSSLSCQLPNFTQKLIIKRSGGNTNPLAVASQTGPFYISLENGEPYQRTLAITSATPTDITDNTAVLGGTIEGTLNFTGERGIVWSTSATPTINDHKVQIGTGTGTFSATVSSLPPATTIYARAYHIVSSLTTYGAEQSFGTLSNNTAPTALALSNATIAEQVANNTSIGTLSTTDAEGGTMTYALVAGTGDTDNASFTITNDALSINASPDYETKSSYSILVQVTDSQGATFTKQFNISVTDVDEVIKVVAVKAPDNGTYYYQGNNLQFEVKFSQNISFTSGQSGITLQIKVGETEKMINPNAILNYNTLGFAYNPTSTDIDLDGIEILGFSLNGAVVAPSGYSIDPTLVNVGPTIGVLIETKPPTDITLSSSTVRSGSPVNTKVALATGIDPQNDATNFELVTGSGDTDNAAFSFSGSQLSTTVATDIVLKPSYSIRVKVSDPAGLSFEKQFTITVTPDITPSANKIIYVNKNVTGGNGTGDSWANAATELADVLRWARTNVNNNLWDSENPLQVWVATGTYQPLFSAEDGAYTTDGSGNNAFVLVNNVQLYGGFSGNETTMAERDLSITTNETVLSRPNTYHVVIGAGNVENARLDGFTIKPMITTSATSAITVNGQSIARNYGGGIFLKSSSPTISNVLVQGNGTVGNTGGIYLNGANPILTNVTITANNIGGFYGSGMYMVNSAPVLNHVVFNSNIINGLFAQSSSPKLNNVIFSGNKGPVGTAIYSLTSTITAKNIQLTGNIAPNSLILGANSLITLENATITGNFCTIRSPKTKILEQNGISKLTIKNSVIWGNNEQVMTTLAAGSSNNYIEGNAAFHGTETLDQNNFFVNPVMATESVATTGGDFRLKAGSPLINAGSNTLFTDLDVNTTDVAGYKRVTDYEGSGIIDIGAYESFNNSAPTAIALSATSIAENVAANTVIGQFSATDVDGGPTTYALVTGEGDTDNGSFAIDGRSLKILSSPDFEAKSTYSIRVQVSDADGLTYQQQLTININNVAETGQANTITFAALTNKTYGNATFELTATASSGLAVSYVSNDPTIASISGTTVTIHKAGTVAITASQAGNESYSVATDVEQQLTIEKRQLNLTASASSKPYDGNALASVTITDDRLSGDELTVGYESATFADETTGTAKTVSISGITLSGASADNYQLATTTLSTTAAIVAIKAISVTTVSSATSYSETVPLELQVAFPSSVTVTGSPLLNFVLSGSVKSATYVSGSGTDMLKFSYTPANVEGVGVKDFELLLNGGTLKIADNFDVDLDLSHIAALNNIAIDAVPLAFSAISFVSNNTNQNVAKVGDVVTLTFTTGLLPGLPSVKIAGHDVTPELVDHTGDEVTFEGLAFILKATYTLTSSDTEGPISFAIDATDAGGHTAAYSSADHPTVVSFDQTRPTVTFTTTASDPAGAVIPVTATFTESVTAFDASSFEIYNGTVSNISGSGNTYTFDVNVTANGFVMLNLLENKVTDAAGNGNEYSPRFGMTANVTSPQTISFSSPGNKTYGDAAFDLVATASSELPVSFSSSDPLIASITGNKLTIHKAGEVSITASQAGNASYSAAPDEVVTLTIQPKAITVTAVAKTKTFGDNDTELTYTYTGTLVGTDSFSGSLTRTAGEHAAVYEIKQGDLSLGSNYTLSYHPEQLTITKRNLMITVEAQDKVYDGSKTGYPRITGTDVLQGSDIVVLPYGTFDDKNVGNNKPYTINLSIAWGANKDDYNLVDPVRTTTASITPAPLSLVVTGNSKIYGNADPEFVYEQPELFGDDVLTGQLSRTAGEDVGSYAITLGNLTSNNNYEITINEAQLQISPRSLTVIAQANNKNYDANTNATITLSDNRKEGDLFATTYNNAFFTDSTVGTAKTVTVTGIAISGGASSNYVLANHTASTSADINKGVITGIALANGSFTYDGTPKSIAITGLSSGISVRYAGNGKTMAGSYPVTATVSMENYNDLILNANLTISKADLTVTANSATKTYDQTAYSGGNGVTYSTFAGGDNAASLSGILTYSGSSQGAVNAGDYVIIPGGLTSPNYNINFINAPLSIARANLMVTAKSQTKTYDQTAYSGGNGVTYSAFAGNDDASSLVGTLTYSGSSQGAVNAGDYVIIPGGLTSTNYNISFVNGALSIAKANATLTLSNLNQSYDGTAKTVSVTTSPTGLNGVTLTYDGNSTAPSAIGNYVVKATLTHPNYLANDAIGTLVISKLDQLISFNGLTARTYGDADFGLTATSNSGLAVSYSSSNPSVASISGSTVTIHGAGNTIITAVQEGNTTYNSAVTVQQQLTVSPKHLMITAENKNKTYGASMPDLTLTYSGFVNRDDVASLATQPSISTSATINSPTGSYPITVSGAASANYTIAYVAGNLTVTPASISITANAQTKIYGDEDPSLTYTIEGALAPGDSFTGSLERSAGNNVGSYTINQGTLALNSNYSLIYHSADLVVSPAVLQIKADDKSRSYLQANPAFTAVYTGLKLGDTPANLTTAPSISTIATTSTPVGTYAINLSGAVGDNYTITYQNAMLTITPANRTLTFAPIAAKTYGDADFATGAVLTSAEPIEYASSNTAVATIVNGKVHIVGAGSTVITASAPVNVNYNDAPAIQQQFTVNKAAQTITFVPIPELIKGNKYDLSAVMSSAGLPVSFTIGDANIATVTNTNLNTLAIGSTSVTAMALGNANYLPANAVTNTLRVIAVDGATLIVRKAISPNGDGINDFLYIEGVKDHPENKVLIINRNGVKIAEINNYDNSTRVFDGRSNVNGQVQSAGTYFYMVETKIDGKVKRDTGYFILKYTN